jgi:hypothetical protein
MHQDTVHLPIHLDYSQRACYAITLTAQVKTKFGGVIDRDCEV